MKHNTMIKAFFTTTFAMLICVSFSFAQSSAKKPDKFVKKDKTVQKSQKKQVDIVLQGQMTGTTNNNNTLTAAQQADKDLIEYTPTNQDYSHSRSQDVNQSLQNASEQRVADYRQQRLNNLPLDGSLIQTNFRTLINP